MEEKQYTTLAILWATEVLKGNKTVEAVKIESLRLQVEEILANKDLLVSVFTTRVMEGMETLETVPVGIRAEVEDFLGKQTTSIILLVADIIDGVKTLEDVPVSIRNQVELELIRYTGGK